MSSSSPTPTPRTHAFDPSSAPLSPSTRATPDATDCHHAEFHTDISNNENPCQPRRKSRKSPLRIRIEQEDSNKTSAQRNECKEVVRDLVRKVWNLKADRDIEIWDSATNAQSEAYKLEEGPGPDPDHLLLYMHGGIDGRWNNSVCEILLDRLMTQDMRARLWPTTSDYMLDVIARKCTTLRANWRKSRPQLLADERRVETADEVTARLRTGSEETRKKNRQDRRRKTVRGFCYGLRI